MKKIILLSLVISIFTGGIINLTADGDNVPSAVKVDGVAISYGDSINLCEVSDLFESDKISDESLLIKAEKLSIKLNKIHERRNSFTANGAKMLTWGLTFPALVKYWGWQYDGTFGWLKWIALLLVTRAAGRISYGFTQKILSLFDRHDVIKILQFVEKSEIKEAGADKIEEMLGFSVSEEVKKKIVEFLKQKYQTDSGEIVTPTEV